MPLGLEVMVLPRVAPGHGACAVPGGREHEGSEDSPAGWRQQGPQSLPLLTWGCSGKQCTGVSGPESWGSGQFHHTGDRNGEGVGGTRVCQASLPPTWACPLCLQPGLLTTTRMCLAKSLELPIRKSEKAVCGRQRRHHLVTETFPHHLWQGPCGAWEEGCCWAGTPRLTPA